MGSSKETHTLLYSFLYFNIQVSFFLPDEVMILLAPMDTTVNITDTAVFTCSASGIPVPTIVWFKDGEPLDATTNVTTNETVATSQLDLGALLLSDEGRYSCNASNSVSDSEVKEFTLTLQSELSQSSQSDIKYNDTSYLFQVLWR